MKHLLFVSNLGVDDENTDGDITNKFGINQLAPEGKFSCEYTIEIK